MRALQKRTAGGEREAGRGLLGSLTHWGRWVSESALQKVRLQVWGDPAKQGGQ